MQRPDQIDLSIGRALGSAWSASEQHRPLLLPSNHCQSLELTHITSTPSGVEGRACHEPAAPPLDFLSSEVGHWQLTAQTAAIQSGG